MYNEFAYIYDELMDSFDYSAWYSYIKDIYTRYKLEPENILEMACGTGNMSYHLAKAGYRLDCFDLSTDMLTLADSKLNEFSNTRIFRQDMVNFKMDRKYDSILCICDSLNYILEDKDLEKVFKNVYDHLEEGGIFIFDINSYYKLTTIIGNNTFIEDREDIFYSWENFYDKARDICQFYLNFFVEIEDGLYERFVEEHFERAYREDEIIEKLKKVGFKDIDIFNAFSFNPVGKETERINFVVTK